MKKFNIKRFVVFAIFWVTGIIAITQECSGQTLFQTAKSDAIITFRTDVESLSQLKLNVGSSTLGYGYYYTRVSDKGKGILINLELNAKPQDGVAAIVKEGRIQPGIGVNGAIGYRMAFAEGVFNMLDLYLKPEYSFNSYSIYDVDRTVAGKDALYKTTRSTYGGNLLVNYAIAPGRFNIYIGAQLGLLSSNNAEDLSKASIQTVETYPGSPNKSVISNVREVRKGQLQDKTLVPLKFDLVFDTGIELFKMQKSGTRLGTFGYYRTDLKEALPRNRIGVGLSFLDKQNPSKILTSIGYELPAFGSGVSTEERMADKGIVFVSVGFTVFKS